MFDPDLESVEFQALKFTAFLIGRVYFLLGKCELIFSNLSAAAALLVTFPAEGKSDKDFNQNLTVKPASKLIPACG